MADRQQAGANQDPGGEQADQPGMQGSAKSGSSDQGDGISGQGGNPGSGRGESAVDQTGAANEAAGAGGQGAGQQGGAQGGAQSGAQSGAQGAEGESGREQLGDREGRGGYGNDTGFTGGTVGSRDEGSR